MTEIFLRESCFYVSPQNVRHATQFSKTTKSHFESYTFHLVLSVFRKSRSLVLLPTTNSPSASSLIIDIFQCFIVKGTFLKSCSKHRGCCFESLSLPLVWFQKL